MKPIYSLLSLSLLFVGCQPAEDKSANEVFERNSQTALAYLQGYQNENPDYSQFAKDFITNDTGFGGKDSINLEQFMMNEKNILAQYDFKILTEPLVFLPGVNVDTKKADGSVRYYADWQVTRPAAEGVEAKSGIIRIYESLDFDENGKIRFQQAYGDFSGLMMYLNGGGGM